MAKNKAVVAEDNDLFTKLVKTSGGGILADLPPVKYYIDSGALAVNCICSGLFISGGYPGGRIIEIVGPSMGGKCVSEDMEVLLADGRVKTIGQVVKEKDKMAQIVSFDEDSKRFKPLEVSDFWDNGVKDCWECVTKSGRRVVTTINHKYLTPDGWRHLEDIKNGDFIAVTRNVPFFGNKSLPEDEVKFLAYMLAEGCCVANCVKNSTGKSIKNGYSLNKQGRPILKKYGVLGHSARTKFIPDEIFTCPKEQVALFLRVFYSCDGCKYKNSIRHDISITLANEKMVRQIQHLLTRFGIVSTFKYKVSKYNGKKFDSWRLSIRSHEYINLFLQHINFMSYKHTDILPERKHRSFVDGFPGTAGVNFYQELKQEMGGGIQVNNRTKTGFYSKFGRKKASAICYRINKGGIVTKTYNKHIESGIMWDKVVSINHIGKRHTYDLTVPKNHNFVANDCVVHNSVWGGNFARGVQIIKGVPVYVDAENAMNVQFAVRSSHLDPYKIVRYGPKDNIECLEKAFIKIHNIIRKVREEYGQDKPLGFVYDSLSVSPSARELRETGVSEDFTEAEWKRVVGGKEQPGERARIINKELRKLESTLEKTDTTLLIIQQLRKNIGVQYGKTEVSAVANDAMEYYSCIRLRVSAHKKIENKLGKIIGVNLKIRNIKNRITAPFVEAEGIQLFYEKGVNPLSGLVKLLEQMERIEAVGKGFYAVKEPWAGGQTVTFKATKTANLMDEETLCKCPALIDAKDEQQVRDYLAPFSEAIKQTLSDDNVEKDVSDEEGGLI